MTELKQQEPQRIDPNLETKRDKMKCNEMKSNPTMTHNVTKRKDQRKPGATKERYRKKQKGMKARALPSTKRK
jgi:hypothetical protein